MQGETRKKLVIVAVSDTHGVNNIILSAAKGLSGDIFIHAGDFTKRGSEESFVEFLKTLDQLNFKHKIVIAGNHEVILDNGTMDPTKRLNHLKKYPCKLDKATLVSQLKKRCIYLEHQSVEVEGIKIFGSPYTLQYCQTAFQYKPHMDEVIWNKIPEGVDILVTHCPPYGILDKSNKGKFGGSKALKIMSQKIKPKYHIFGHIHQGRGIHKNANTVYLNVAKEMTKFVL